MQPIGRQLQHEIDASAAPHVGVQPVTTTRCGLGGTHRPASGAQCVIRLKARKPVPCTLYPGAQHGSVLHKDSHWGCAAASNCCLGAPSGGAANHSRALQLPVAKPGDTVECIRLKVRLQEPGVAAAAAAVATAALL
jgi:hypothetical protein